MDGVEGDTRCTEGPVKVLWGVIVPGLILYALIEIIPHIKADVEKGAYWRGVDDARARCYDAHRECLADSMDDRMKADIAVARKKFKGSVK